MTFQPDYPGAITDFRVNPSGYGYTDEAGNPRVNRPVAIVLHTPEEPADDYESTPHYFAQPGVAAGTHYYLDNDGDVYQMLPESECPYANGTKGGPGGNRVWKGQLDTWAPWATVGLSNNCQTISIEMEGYAASIGQTWNDSQHAALIALIRNIAYRYSIPLDRDHIVGHFELATDRVDPGATFPWDRVMASLAAKPAPAVLPPVPVPTEAPIEASPELMRTVQEALQKPAAMWPLGYRLNPADRPTHPAFEHGAGVIPKNALLARYVIDVLVNPDDLRLT